MSRGYLSGDQPMARQVADILRDIDSFQPVSGSWRPLDDLLAELWESGVTDGALASLFGVFERFPDEDGAGVFWSIVHGLEALPLDYGPALRASLARRTSLIGRVMLDRLERS